MTQLPAILFEHVDKRFVFTADRPGTLLEALLALFRRRAERGPLWAVRDVSFAVQPGHSLGIVGRNGSGKSTVLKLATRILQPTAGQVTVRGRVSALLELGAGFHPDLTGRENIFLNGSVLGLGRRDLQQRFDAIVAFSELEPFIDMPVKHYSSGMYMRLGFSVAVHVDPDVLIVDEILAVGDYAFQSKCLDRIRDLQRAGVTIVMVSHQLQTIRSLCSHALWMDAGRVAAAGPAHEVLEQYLDHFQPAEGPATATGFQRWGSGELQITGVRFLDAAGHERDVFATGDPLTIELAYRAREPVVEPEFGLAIYSADGAHLLGPNTRQAGLTLGTVSGDGVVRYALDRLPFLPGRYRVTVAAHDTRLPRAFDYHEEAYAFRVRAGTNAPAHGLLDLPAHWEFAPAHPAPAP